MAKLNSSNRGFLIFIIIIFLFIFSMPTIRQAIFKNNVSIHIDGTLNKINSTSIDTETTKYYSLDDIFYFLGYKLDFNRREKTLTITNQNREIFYKLGNGYTQINNKFVYISHPIVFQNGKFYTSIETIDKLASTFSLVEENNLYIESPPNIRFLEPNDTINVSTYNKDYQMMAEIIEDNLNIRGHIKDGNTWIFNTVSKNLIKEIAQGPILKDNFDYTSNLYKNLSFVNMTFNANRANSSFDHKFYLNISPRFTDEVFSLDALENEVLKKETLDNLTFIRPSNYNSNLALYNENSLYHPKGFLDLDFLKSSREKDAIKTLANSVTKDIEGDYNKAMEIYKWIVNNIYYDYEKYYSDYWSGQDPYQALQDKKTLCEGFSFLYMAMCRSIDLPTKMVFGFAGDTSLSKEDLIHTRYGHAWNEVFVDDRWVIVDSTWGSKNTYNKGFYTKNQNSFLFFDTSLKQLSNTHLIEIYPLY